MRFKKFKLFKIKNMFNHLSTKQKTHLLIKAFFITMIILLIQSLLFKVVGNLFLKTVGWRELALYEYFIIAIIMNFGYGMIRGFKRYGKRKSAKKSQKDEK